MNTCACCGQSLKLESRPIVKVDDALLSLCNEAYANAEARASGEVSVADLTWCIARAVHWPRDIERAGVSPDGLVRSAEMQIARAVRAPRGGSVSTSSDLKTMLLRAECWALENGRVAAAPGDFLHVLFRQADDLAGAGFVQGERAAAGTRESGHRAWESTEAARSNRFGDRREADRATMSPDGRARSGEAQIEALSDRLLREERLNAELRLKLETLVDQIASMSARMARIGDWERRLEAQERQIGELQRLADTLVRQSATATARLAQAVDVGRANSELLEEIERRLRESEIHRSDRGRRRPRFGSARSRLRRSRRRAIRLKLRARRRAGMYSRRVWRRRASDRLVPIETPQADRRPLPAMHAAPLATHQDFLADRFEAAPRPFLESVPSIPQTPAVQPLDLEEEIAEPIEEEDDFGLEGALGERPKRFYLALGDHVERAPSIGPRTAERLSAVGVATVRDLLAADPQVVASRAASRYVSVERVAAWKSQARLVCTVPWLRGTHAQLLVGAGYDTLDKLQRANTSDVCAGILQFAATREGQSVLRSGAPPAPERIALWMGHVTLAEPERGRLAA